MAGGTIGIVAERLKWEREQRVRYKQVQMEHYAELLAAGFAFRPEQPSVEEITRLIAANSTVAIVGSMDGMAAATEYVNAVMNQGEMVDKNAPEEARIAARKLKASAHTRLQTAARQDWHKR